ncbi:MAG: glycoside hydrolase family 127 protein, partial [Candidatus Theseobacter exili]|nr:glycoside hydrolase family 127 protein [Candidatus Theseobacter exili]
MKSSLFKLFLTIIATITIFGCGEHKPDMIEGAESDKIQFRVLPFELTDVKLLDGPFKSAMELNIRSLLNYEPDRFLAKFRSEAGLEPRAEHYHGWEDNTIAGHSLGHYLTACSEMYQSSGDVRFLERVNYIVSELKECQEADGEGYFGAFPEGKRILEEEVAKGDIRSKGFDLNGIWVPFYTQHKVMAGLRDAYHLCGNQDAIGIEAGLADWISTIVKDLDHSQIQEMLNCEHGGINEVLAELYADTGDEKYLDFSRVFHHEIILDSLAAGIDILPGKHCNTQIPKLVGLARRYELTADSNDMNAAKFFWSTVVNHHSYVTGGNGNHEYFGEPDHLNNRLSDGTTETCNVNNMLKLSRHLFLWDAKAEVADYYERALFNHILSSQNPNDGRVIYNLSLEMGGKKEYQNPLWFTCCVGTGMENHSVYGRNIYFYNHQELFVSQYIASELTWKEKEVVLTQKTGYPSEQNSEFTVGCSEPVTFTLNIRYPGWAEEEIEILVNSKKQRVSQSPGSFIPLRRQWKDGDVVEVKIPFTLRTEPMPDNPSRVAVMYGPLVMAGDLGPENDPEANDPLYVPVLMTEDKDPASWLKPVEGEPNTFRTEDVGHPRDIILKPFFKTHERRYSVYWDLFTESKWNQKQ